MTGETTAPVAVLWDMDGTLIDSEPDWIGSEIELCSRFGVDWTEADGLTLVGNPLDYSARILIDRGVDLSVDQVIDFLVTRVTRHVRARVPWQPDARALVERLHAQGLPCALVTMSYAPLAAAFIEQAPFFDAVVTGDQVAHGKPHPEPYLTAAAHLGVDVTRCLAIEDSPSGVGSALAAGARTVGVQRLVAVEPRPGLSRVLSLDDLDDATIARIMAGELVDTVGSAVPAH